MKRWYPSLLLFLPYETLPSISLYFYCKKCHSPPYLFFSLHETLFPPHTFFFHSMKRWYSLLLLFLLYETLTLHAYLFFIANVPFLHTFSFFTLLNAIPSTYLLFPLYETLVLLTSSFSTL